MYKLFFLYSIQKRSLWGGFTGLQGKWKSRQAGFNGNQARGFPVTTGMADHTGVSESYIVQYETVKKPMFREVNKNLVLNIMWAFFQPVF